MIDRRPLGETLGAFADVAELLATGEAQILGVRSLDMELPLDLRIAPAGDGVELVADLPQFLTRTAFDPEPARLAITFHAVPPTAEAPAGVPALPRPEGSPLGGPEAGTAPPSVAGRTTKGG